MQYEGHIVLSKIQYEGHIVFSKIQYEQNKVQYEQFCND